MSEKTVSKSRVELVRIHEGFTLEKAKDRIRSPHATDRQYCVHRFSKVMPPGGNVRITESMIRRIYRENPEDFAIISLEKITSGIYVKYSEKFEGSERQLIEMFRAPRNLKMPQNYEELEELHDTIIKRLAKGEKAVYGVNFEKVPEPFEASLVDVPDLISPDKNLGRERMVGINVPTFYLASKISLTEMHHEDALLESTNGMLAGGWKVWVVVNPDMNIELIKEVRKDLQQKQKDVEEKIKTRIIKRKKERLQNILHLIKEWEKGCANPFSHKKLVVTTAYLNEKKIKFKIMIQKNGELTFLDIGTHHQVINLAESLNEAVNVGGPLWDEFTKHNYLCGCKGREVINIKSTQTQSIKVKRIDLKAYICNNCGACYTKKSLFKFHIATHNKGKEKRFDCIDCPKTYATSWGLTLHRNKYHSKEQGKVSTPGSSKEGQKTKEEKCSICGLTVTKKRISNHKKVHEMPDGSIQKETTCPYCQTKLKSWQGLKKHVTPCYRKYKEAE